MNLEDLDHLLAVQDGVVSRVQVLKCGGKPHDIRRRLRRREWASLSDGGSIGLLLWARGWPGGFQPCPAWVTCDSEPRAGSGSQAKPTSKIRQ